MKLTVMLTKEQWELGRDNPPLPLGEITTIPGVSAMHSLTSPVMIDGKPYYLKVYVSEEPVEATHPPASAHSLPKPD